MKTLNSTILLMFLAIAMTFTACSSDDTSNVQQNDDPLSTVIDEQEALDYIRRELKCHTANIVNFAQERLAFVMAESAKPDFLDTWCGQTINCDINAVYIPHSEEPETNTRFENGKLEYSVDCNPVPVFNYTYTANDVVSSKDNVAGSGTGTQNASGTLECDDPTNPRNIVVNTDNMFSRNGEDFIPNLGTYDTEFKLNVTEQLFVNAIDNNGNIVEGTITQGAAKYEAGFINDQGIKVTAVGDINFLGGKKATIDFMGKEYIIDWNDLANPTFEVKQN